MKKYSKTKEIIKKIGSKRRFISIMLKIYNELCHNCKLLVQKNPKADVSEYCATCQEMIKERLSKYAE